MKQTCKPSKVVIVGAGKVGTSLAYALMIRSVVSEIVLVDIDKDKVKGEVMDLSHGMAFVETVKVRAGSYSDCKGADYVVITAGAKQRPGETRLDLAIRNTEILKEILPKILKNGKGAKLMLVTNPVDVLTHVALKISGLPRSDVFGSGTTLDTARFRFLLGEHFGVSPDSIDAFIVGEHGDSEVAVYSQAQIAGIPLRKMEGYSVEKMKEIYRNTRDAAYQVIERKGATHFGIGLVGSELIEAMELNQQKVMPVSVELEGEFGLKNVALSLPCVLGKSGVTRVMPISMNGNELRALKKSAEKLSGVIKSLRF